MIRWQMRVVALALAVLASACSTVQPWQRGDLARPEMAFEPDPVLGAGPRHRAVSKEAAPGRPPGGGGGGGGQ